jgi:hypothetical protein
VYRNPTDVVCQTLDLPGVNARSYLDSKGVARYPKGLGKPDGSGGSVESSEDPITCGLDASPAVTFEFTVSELIVIPEDRRPPLIAHPCGMLG